MLNIEAMPDVGSFVADERRGRQVLFNLLAYAVGFSPVHGIVTLSCDRRDDSIVWSKQSSQNQRGVMKVLCLKSPNRTKRRTRPRSLPSPAT